MGIAERIPERKRELCSPNRVCIRRGTELARRKRALRAQFDGKLKLEFHGTKITSDAGLLAFRELDEAFRLTEKASIMFSDTRRGKNT